MTDGLQTTDERTVASAQPSDVSVTMIATPGDASCGIGTYARDLTDAFEDARTVEDDGESAASVEREPTAASGPTAADERPATNARSTTDATATSDTIEIEQDDPTARHFVGVALRAAARGSDVVHVQHEYGLYRRPGSRYPGVLGLVFFPVLWLMTRLRRQSITVTLHSVLSPAPEEASFATRWYLLAMHELIARVADHVIFLSEECEERFHDDVAQAPEEYSVLPHGVNVSEATSASRTGAREHFGFDHDDSIVVIPGFVRPPKGHDVFVEVAAELPEVEFLIAGGAREKGFDAGFAAAVAEDAPENVTITGVLDDEDFPLALATADLALLPYRVVTQSGTFNWCAAQELPVLASDEPYFERIEREWDALETIALDDTDAIAKRVETLLHDDRRRAELSQNVRQYKAANSFETVAAEHARIYQSLATGVAIPVVADDEAAPASDDEQLRAACSAQREATATSD